MAIYQEQNWGLVRLFKAMSAITLTVGCLSASGNCALAQNITLDGTLGSAGTLTGPIYTIPQGVGQTVGSNLFHSFGQFSLDTGEVSLFQSGAEIRNILSRVTGGSPSIINGLIFTQSSSVNLFLINPSGIQFGPNALLNIGSATRGSFVATTVDTLVWPNGAQFSATNPGGANSLLTIVGDPGGFLSTLQRPAPIVSFSNLLDVYGGQSLLLLGGDVRLEGGVLLAPGGRVELGGLSAPGTVGLNVNGNLLSLSFPDEVARADVSLSNRTQLSVVASNGGSVGINARNLEVLSGSRIVAGIGTGQGNVNAQVGDIVLNATGTIRVSESSGIGNQVNGIGNGGDIKITTHSLAVTDGAQLVANIRGRGNAGNVKIIASDTVSFAGVNSNGVASGAYSTVAWGGEGQGGDIEITTNFLSVTNGAVLSASAFGRGNAGNVRIKAGEAVSFAGVGSNGESSGTFSQLGIEGQGGDIEITTNSLAVTDGARLNTTTFGRGNAGNVRIIATETVSFAGVGSNGNSSGAFSRVGNGANGKGGDIEISTNSLSVTDGARLSASTSGRGNAGIVRIIATDTVSFAGVGSNGNPSEARSLVEQRGEGNGGDIEITTNSLAVTDGAQLAASTLGRGNAGNVRIIATDTVTFAGASAAFSTVEQGGEGKGGDIEISTNFLSVSDGSQLLANTRGQGDAGNVRIRATNTVSFAGVDSDGFPSVAGSLVQQGAEGNGGDVEIITNSLAVTDGAHLAASTFGRGDAGNVRIRATDTVSFAGVGSNKLYSAAFSAVGEGGEGNGGNVEITTNSLYITDGAALNATTFGQGDAGNVRITATEKVSFSGGDAFSSVEKSGEGNGGDIEITTHSLALTDGAQLVVSTRGRGNAGNVRIRATEKVSFSGGGAFSSVDKSGEGNGGDIEITTHSLSVTDGAQLAAATSGRGDAGNVRIRATEKVSFAGGDAFSSVDKSGEGNGGDIEITTHSLSVTDGAQLIAITFGRGDAGNVRITATEKVSFAGVSSNRFLAGAFSAVAEGGNGNGGDIEITTGSLSLTDAFITSESRGNGRAGDITIETRENLELDRSNISATTQSDDGGNIRLRVGDLLLLRNDSNISTTAGQAGAGGDGGNITINADFVVAVPKEDSDITANAFNGRGGNINITTQGIYGLTFRKQDIPASSDITASSQFGVDGEFQLDLLTDVDPSQGLGELPANLVDATGLIDRRCTPTDNARGSRFIITGRGGLPPSPNDVLQNEEVIVNWISLNSQQENTNPVPPEANPTNTAPKRLVEAQSWVYGSNGEVILTAEAPTATPHGSWQTSPSCDNLLQ